MSTKRPSISTISELIQKYVGSDYDKIKEISDNLPAILAGTGLTLTVDYTAQDFPQTTLKALLEAYAIAIKSNETAGNAIPDINASISEITESIAGILSTAAFLDTFDVSTFDWFLDEDDMISNSPIKAASQQSIRAFVLSTLQSSGGFKGKYDATTDTPNLDYSDSFPTIPIGVGHNWIVDVAGTFFTAPVAKGDALYALIATPTLEADWLIVPNATDAVSIKSLYESNADTNEFSDSEQTKLSGVELGATADQTGAEIKALYEVEVNAFTDAQFTKLAGIETAATADLDGSEIKGLLFAEADTNNLDDTLLTKLNGVEANATVDQTGEEIKTALFLEADTNNLDDTLLGKLDAIEALADVTDSTNVDAAGAVMNADTSTAAMGFVIDEDSFISNSATKVPTQQSTKAYISTFVAAQISTEKSYKGGYDVSSNIPNLEAPTAVPAVGSVKKGDVYDATSAGLFFTETIEIGDTLRANKDNPAALTDWVIIQSNLTAESIKTQYESNGDTNAFTNAQETKVGFISVTQAVDLDTIEFDTNTNNTKVSADGSVTTHSDVTDAGSGIIISTAERNKLAAISNNNVLQVVSTATANITVSNKNIVQVDYTTTGACTLTFLTADITGSDRWTVDIKDSGGSAQTANITITTQGSELIDGAATYTLDNNYEATTIYNDGTNLWIK